MMANGSKWSGKNELHGRLRISHTVMPASDRSTVLLLFHVPWTLFGIHYCPRVIITVTNKHVSTIRDRERSTKGRKKSGSAGKRIRLVQYRRQWDIILRPLQRERNIKFRNRNLSPKISLPLLPILANLITDNAM